MTWTKEQQSEYGKKWYRNNKERHQELMRIWNENHIEYLKEYQRRWYEENKTRHNALNKIAVGLRKEERKEYAHKYYMEHKDYYKSKHRSWNLAHPELRKEYSRKFRDKKSDEYKQREKKKNKEWAKSHPENIIAGSQRRRAIKLTAPGNGITAEQSEHLKVLGLCSYCGKKTKLTIDHVVPLIAGGRHDIDNAVPACQSCNSTKKDKSLMMFLYDRYLIRG